LVLGFSLTFDAGQKSYTTIFRKKKLCNHKRYAHFQLIVATDFMGKKTLTVLHGDIVISAIFGASKEHYVRKGQW